MYLIPKQFSVKLFRFVPGLLVGSPSSARMHSFRTGNIIFPEYNTEANLKYYVLYI